MIRPGQRWAKLRTDRRGVTTVQSRIVLALVLKGAKVEAVIYTRKRPRCRYRATYAEWRKWVRGACLCKS